MAGTVHELSFERSAYSADAIQRAAYRMSDRVAIDIVPAGECWRCTIHFLDPAVDPEPILDEFRNRTLDETLRERIRAETADVRNLILSLAFSESGLVAGADPDGVPLSDGQDV